MPGDSADAQWPARGRSRWRRREEERTVKRRRSGGRTAAGENRLHFGQLMPPSRTEPSRACRSPGLHFPNDPLVDGFPAWAIPLQSSSSSVFRRCCRGAEGRGLDHDPLLLTPHPYRCPPSGPADASEPSGHSLEKRKEATEGLPPRFLGGVGHGTLHKSSEEASPRNSCCTQLGVWHLDTRDVFVMAHVACPPGVPREFIQQDSGCV